MLYPSLATTSKLYQSFPSLSTTFLLFSDTFCNRFSGFLRQLCYNSTRLFESQHQIIFFSVFLSAPFFILYNIEETPQYLDCGVSSPYSMCTCVHLIPQIKRFLLTWHSRFSNPDVLRWFHSQTQRYMKYCFHRIRPYIRFVQKHKKTFLYCVS